MLQSTRFGIKKNFRFPGSAGPPNVFLGPPDILGTTNIFFPLGGV